MDFQDNTTRIILALIALLAVGVIIKISIKKKSKVSSSNNNLKDVNAGRDIVFGNKKAKN